MSEQQDKQKAIEALHQSPFVPGFHDDSWLWKGPDGHTRTIGLGETTATLILPLCDIPLFLNPITQDRVEKAVLDELSSRWQDGELTIEQVHWLRGGIMARLFPLREPSTDASPG